ncbi:MAG: DUF3800 domain-containing protein [Verrucomicrobiaceae bacterium]|nr:DUF3800 domain-containing protein [Verrucomicrobiaceae bacterium]
MSETLNFYCDESCHLLNDHQKVMTLGTVWCPMERRREISERLREIKARHGLPPAFEVKWGKVSPAKALFYQDWLDFFLDDDDLHFRAVVVPDKSVLNHDGFGQSHDDWYHKMYFVLLSGLLKPENKHRIYIDLKDTHSARKMKKLHEVLCNNAYDFDRKIIERVQVVASHESELVQLADLLVGAVSYANRGLSGNAGKEQLIARLKKRTNKHLTQTTLLNERKVNLLIWKGGGAGV